MKPYPNASSYRDRHGKVRWRFRRAGKTTPLPGQPGEPEFEAAYRAAVTGVKPRRAEVVRHPAAAEPKSLKACWQVVTAGARWRLLEPQTRETQARIAERFLTAKIPGGPGVVWGDFPVELLDRGLVDRILAERADTPHAASHVLRLLRRLTGAALDRQWITTDPTYRVSWRPPLDGHRAWTSAEREAFEAHWPVGSTPRLVYALALYTGARRSDLADLSWSSLDGDGIEIAQRKTDTPIWIPLHPDLRRCLDAAPRHGAAIVLGGYGNPYSEKALGMRFAAWCRKAGVPAGATLHGLRKSMGKALAESGATTKEIMAILGHTAIEHAQLYSRDAEQKIMAKSAMRKLTRAGVKPVKP